LPRTLYHLPLSAASRKFRVVLAEKGLPFELKVEKTWERRPEFVVMNPACEVPVLVEEDGTAVADTLALTEYLEETYPERRLWPEDPKARLEARRLNAWFDVKFDREVGRMVGEEKLLRRYLGIGTPNSEAIRQGLTSLRQHLAYVDWLADQRKWLAGDELTMADIAAATQISVIDYLGDVPWDGFPDAKAWYAKVKSRPSFRPVLSDYVPGLPPPRHYANPDF